LYKELQKINCRLALIHHMHGMRFRNAACEQTCDCKQSDNPFGEFTKGNMELQNLKDPQSSVFTNTVLAPINYAAGNVNKALLDKIPALAKKCSSFDSDGCYDSKLFY
jgi:hypothetical protein